MAIKSFPTDSLNLERSVAIVTESDPFKLELAVTYKGHSQGSTSCSYFSNCQDDPNAKQAPRANVPAGVGASFILSQISIQL